MTRAPLARSFRSGRKLTGLIAKLPCSAQIEMAADAGFDFVVLDTEHGPSSGIELEHHLRAADAAGLPALVRASSAAAGEILAALDAGAVGVVVPHVRDAEEAAAAVAAARYPPAGRRGFATSTRAGRFGAVPPDEHLSVSAEHTCVVVQIEDAEAVPRAAEILSISGVDAVLIGTVDLAVSFGLPVAPPHGVVDQAVDEIIQAAESCGRSALAVAANGAEAAAWRARGVSGVLAVSTALIRSAFIESARALRADDSPLAETAPLVVLPGMLGDEELWSGVAAELRGRVALQGRRIDLDDSVPEMAESVLASAPPVFALAGHSLGGIVALEIVRRAPERVTRLALLNASARPPSEGQLESWAEMRDRTAHGAFEEVVSQFARSCLPVVRRGERELLGRTCRMGARVGPGGFCRQLAAQETRPDSGPSLRSIDVPVLVISGAEDEVCPTTLQEEMVAGVRGAEHVVLEDVGHLSPLEAPRAVAQALANWFGETTEGRPAA